MHIRWARSNEILLTFLVIAMVLVGVLAFLVVRQQKDQAIDEIDRQVSRQTLPVASAPSKGSTPDPAQTPSKSGISGQAPGQPDTAVVDVPSQGNTPVPAQKPSSPATSAQATGQQGAAVVNIPSRSSAPQRANTPSQSDASPQAPGRHRAATADVPSPDGPLDPAVMPSKPKRLTDPSTSPKPDTRVTLITDDNEQTGGAGDPTGDDQFARRW
jgi:cytoskeletal protein RodZ